MIDLLKARPSVFAGVPRCLKSNLAMAFALLIIAIAVSRHIFRRAACLNRLQRSDNLRLRVSAAAHPSFPLPSSKSYSKLDESRRSGQSGTSGRNLRRIENAPEFTVMLRAPLQAGTDRRRLFVRPARSAADPRHTASRFSFRQRLRLASAPRSPVLRTVQVARPLPPMARPYSKDD